MPRILFHCPAMLFPSILAVLLLPLVAADQCPPGYTYESFFDKCYFYNSQPTNFLSAEQYCDKFGGNLVSIHSPIENAYVASLQKTGNVTSGWIGFNLLMSTSTFFWSSAETVDYTDWVGGEPDTSSRSQCASLSTSDVYWRQQLCGSSQTFTCQAQPNTYQTNRTCPTASPCPTCSSCPTQAPTNCSSRACDANWIMYPGNCRCYYISSNSVNAYAKSDVCTAVKATLAKTDSAELNDFLSRLIGSEAPRGAWMGLACPTSNESDCYWSDGTKLGSYRNFLVRSDGGVLDRGDDALFNSDVYNGNWEMGDFAPFSNTANALCEKDSHAL